MTVADRLLDLRSRIDPSSDRLRRILGPLYRWSLARLGEKRGVLVEMAVRGDRFRLHPTFSGIPWPDIEPSVYELIAARLTPGMIFIDAGAWIGQFTLCAARRVGPDGRVLSFEPDPIARRYLKKHLEWNQAEAITDIFPVALGDHDGESDFFLLGSGLQSSNSIIPEDLVRQDKIKVPIATIDSVVERTGTAPDLIKIDVEGAEARVIRGAAQTIRTHKPWIVCSLHPLWMERIGDSEEDVIKFMRECGYGATYFDQSHELPVGFREVLFQPERA